MGYLAAETVPQPSRTGNLSVRDELLNILTSILANTTNVSMCAFK
jgi:hypothetical protein